VQGDAGKSTGTSWINASDRRLKNIVGKYEYGLEEILQLRPVRFTYKNDNLLGLPSDKPVVGFVAQEVEKVIPEAVRTRTDGYLELDVDPIHWAAVNAIQDLSVLCDENGKVLDKKVKHLEDLNNGLRKELESLKEQFQEFTKRQASD